MTITPRAVVAPSVGFDALANANEQLKAKREKPGRVVGCGSSGWLDSLREGLQNSAEPEREPATAPEEAPQFIRVYPSLMNGIRRAEQDVIGRIWLLLRHIDHDGRGWLTVENIREKLTRKESALRVCGQRRLREQLRAGEGIFWERDGRGRLWIYGTVNVCRNIGIEQLTGNNVNVSIEDVTTSLKRYRAAMYSAFIAGKETAPISRYVVAELTGINERSQREYDHVIGIKKTRNYSIDDRRTKDSAMNHAWEHHRASFGFRDHKGKQGEAGATYNARRLPNSYESTHECGTNGRKKKTNQQLKITLVNKWAQGNDNTSVVKIFYPNVRKAGTAIKRQLTAIMRHYKAKDIAMWTTYEGEGRR